MGLLRACPGGCRVRQRHAPGRLESGGSRTSRRRDRRAHRHDNHASAIRLDAAPYPLARPDIRTDAEPDAFATPDAERHP